MIRIGAILCATCLAAPVSVTPPDDGFHQAIQEANAWEHFGGDLLWGFCNMYQPCVVERPGDEYRFKMWFFGWAAADTNPDEAGCDAIYHARSKDLKKWEVYAKDQTWDADMKPERWKAVVSASDRFYDAWHNGDPSVVYRDGRYYMAYSATSKPFHKKTKAHLDGMLLCIMGATSQDGIHWTKTDRPLMIESESIQQAETDTDAPCDFHRPSLLWDDGKWKLWFDYWNPTHGVCMGYAENAGDFAAQDGFRAMHDLHNSLIYNWPNPSIVKAGSHYYAFADPSGYPPKDASSEEAKNWTTRALCEAVSDDGLQWRVIGYVNPDPDAPACHVPQAFDSTGPNGHWLYVFYATQRGGGPQYDYRYNHIRAIRRRLAPAEPTQP